MTKERISIITVGFLFMCITLVHEDGFADICHPQCLEYVQSQTNIGGGYGNANGLWNDIASRNNGWRRVVKGGSEQPHVGDILYWDIDPDGHVAMIRNVVGNTVYIDDRNWDLNCGFRPNVVISLDTDSVVGWLTNDALHPPQTEQEVNTTAYANSGRLAWIPLGVKCKNAMKWIDIDTGEVVADRSIQCVNGDAVCESYGIYPVCSIYSSPY